MQFPSQVWNYQPVNEVEYITRDDAGRVVERFRFKGMAPRPAGGMDGLIGAMLGDPARGTWVAKYLTAHPDECQHLADQKTREKQWSEEQHPRGDDGKWIEKGHILAAAHDPAKAAQLRERVTDPAQREKLNAALKHAKHSPHDFGGKKSGQFQGAGDRAAKVRPPVHETAEAVHRLRAEVGDGAVTDAHVRQLAQLIGRHSVAEIRQLKGILGVQSSRDAAKEQAVAEVAGRALRWAKERMAAVKAQRAKRELTAKLKTDGHTGTDEHGRNWKDGKIQKSGKPDGLRQSMPSQSDWEKTIRKVWADTAHETGHTDGDFEMQRLVGRCIPACDELQKHLSANGVSTTAMRGTYQGDDHVWLQTKDGTVIDPTESQFDRNVPVGHISVHPAGSAGAKAYDGGNPADGWHNHEVKSNPASVGSDEYERRMAGVDPYHSGLVDLPEKYREPSTDDRDLEARAAAGDKRQRMMDWASDKPNDMAAAGQLKGAEDRVRRAGGGELLGDDDLPTNGRAAGKLGDTAPKPAVKPTERPNSATGHQSSGTSGSNAEKPDGGGPDARKRLAVVEAKLADADNPDVGMPYHEQMKLMDERDGLRKQLTEKSDRSPEELTDAERADIKKYGPKDAAKPAGDGENEGTTHARQQAAKSAGRKKFAHSSDVTHADAADMKAGDMIEVGGRHVTVQKVTRGVTKSTEFHPTDPTSLEHGESETPTTSLRIGTPNDPADTVLKLRGERRITKPVGGQKAIGVKPSSDLAGKARAALSAGRDAGYDAGHALYTAALRGEHGKEAQDHADNALKNHMPDPHRHERFLKAVAGDDATPPTTAGNSTHNEETPPTTTARPNSAATEVNADDYASSMDTDVTGRKAGFRNDDDYLYHTMGLGKSLADAGHDRNADPHTTRVTSSAAGHLHGYRSKDNYRIAKKLRAGTDISAGEQEQVDAVNKLANAHGVPHAMQLHRVIGSDVVAGLKPGDTFRDPAPMFTGVRDGDVRNIRVNGGGQKKVTILADKGASAVHVSGGEGPEVILPSNTPLEVVSVGKDEVVMRHRAGPVAEFGQSPVVPPEHADRPAAAPPGKPAGGKMAFERDDRDEGQPFKGSLFEDDEPTHEHEAHKVVNGVLDSAGQRFDGLKTGGRKTFADAANDLGKLDNHLAKNGHWDDEDENGFASMAEGHRKTVKDIEDGRYDSDDHETDKPEDMASDAASQIAEGKSPDYGNQTAEQRLATKYHNRVREALENDIERRVMGRHAEGGPASKVTQDKEDAGFDPSAFAGEIKQAMTGDDKDAITDVKERFGKLSDRQKSRVADAHGVVFSHVDLDGRMGKMIERHERAEEDGKMGGFYSHPTTGKLTLHPDYLQTGEQNIAKMKATTDDLERSAEQGNYKESARNKMRSDAKANRKAIASAERMLAERRSEVESHGLTPVQGNVEWDGTATPGGVGGRTVYRDADGNHHGSIEAYQQHQAKQQKAATDKASADRMARGAEEPHTITRAEYRKHPDVIGRMHERYFGNTRVGGDHQNTRMQYGEYIDHHAGQEHKQAVQSAMNRGESVPADVMADYPDMKAGVHPLTGKPIEPPKEKTATDHVTDRHVQDHFNDYYADDLKSERFLSLPEEKRNELIRNAGQKSRDILEKTAQRIMDKDLSLRDSGTLHPDNKHSRRLFESMTGIALPKTVKGTNQAVEQYLGADKVAAADQSKADERAAEVATGKKKADDERYGPHASDKSFMANGGLTRPKAYTHLDMLMRSNGAVKLTHEHVEDWVKAGGVPKVQTEHSYRKVRGESIGSSKDVPSITMPGGTYFAVSKTAHDYAQHLIDGGQSRTHDKHGPDGKPAPKEHRTVTVDREGNIVGRSHPEQPAGQSAQPEKSKVGGLHTITRGDAASSYHDTWMEPIRRQMATASGEKKKRLKAEMEGLEQRRLEYMDQHEKAVRDAVAAGHEVSPEVLADYPDLAESNEPAKPTAPETTAEFGRSDGGQDDTATGEKSEPWQMTRDEYRQHVEQNDPKVQQWKGQLKTAKGRDKKDTQNLIDQRVSSQVNSHSTHVMAAVDSGKEVPEHVLEEYPHLRTPTKGSPADKSRMPQADANTAAGGFRVERDGEGNARGVVTHNGEEIKGHWREDKGQDDDHFREKLLDAHWQKLKGEKDKLSLGSHLASANHEREMKRKHDEVTKAVMGSPKDDEVVADFESGSGDRRQYRVEKRHNAINGTHYVGVYDHGETKGQEMPAKHDSYDDAAAEIGNHLADVRDPHDLKFSHDAARKAHDDKKLKRTEAYQKEQEATNTAERQDREGRQANEAARQHFEEKYGKVKSRPGQFYPRGEGDKRGDAVSGHDVGEFTVHKIADSHPQGNYSISHRKSGLSLGVRAHTLAEAKKIAAITGEHGNWDFDDEIPVAMLARNVRKPNKDALRHGSAVAKAFKVGDYAGLKKHMDAMDAEKAAKAQAEKASPLPPAATPSAPAPTGDPAAGLTGMHKDQYDDYATILEKQVGNEVNARKKAVVATGLMHNLPPQVQKAMADKLHQIAPDAHEYARNNPSVVPLGMREHFKESPVTSGTSASEPVTDPVGGFDPEQAVKISADSVGELRKPDVFRVLDTARDEHRQAVADHITRNRPDLKAEVADVMGELGGGQTAVDPDTGVPAGTPGRTTDDGAFHEGGEHDAWSRTPETAAKHAQKVKDTLATHGGWLKPSGDVSPYDPASLVKSVENHKMPLGATVKGGLLTDGKLLTRIPEKHQAKLEAHPVAVRDAGHEKADTITQISKDMLDKAHAGSEGKPEASVHAERAQHDHMEYLLRDKEGNEARTDGGYHETMKKLHPGATAHIHKDGENTHVTYRKGGQTVGMFMANHDSDSEGVPADQSQLEEGPTHLGEHFEPARDESAVEVGKEGSRNSQREFTVSSPYSEGPDNRADVLVRETRHKSGLYTISHHAPGGKPMPLATNLSKKKAKELAKQIVAHAHGKDNHGLVFKPKGGTAPVPAGGDGVGGSSGSGEMPGTTATPDSTANTSATTAADQPKWSASGGVSAEDGERAMHEMLAGTRKYDSRTLNQAMAAVEEAGNGGADAREGKAGGDALRAVAHRLGVPDHDKGDWRKVRTKLREHVMANLPRQPEREAPPHVRDALTERPGAHVFDQRADGSHTIWSPDGKWAGEGPAGDLEGNIRDHIGMGGKVSVIDSPSGEVAGGGAGKPPSPPPVSSPAAPEPGDDPKHEGTGVDDDHARRVDAARHLLDSAASAADPDAHMREWERMIDGATQAQKLSLLRSLDIDPDQYRGKWGMHLTSPEQALAPAMEKLLKPARERKQMARIVADPKKYGFGLRDVKGLPEGTRHLHKDLYSRDGRTPSETYAKGDTMLLEAEGVPHVVIAAAKPSFAGGYRDEGEQVGPNKHRQRLLLRPATAGEIRDQRIKHLESEHGKYNRSFDGVNDHSDEIARLKAERDDDTKSDRRRKKTNDDGDGDGQSGSPVPAGGPKSDGSGGQKKTDEPAGGITERPNAAPGGPPHRFTIKPTDDGVSEYLPESRGHGGVVYRSDHPAVNYVDHVPASSTSTGEDMLTHHLHDGGRVEQYGRNTFLRLDEGGNKAGQFGTFDEAESAGRPNSAIPKEDWHKTADEWVREAGADSFRTLDAENINDHPGIKAKAEQHIADLRDAHRQLVEGMHEHGEVIPPHVWASHGLKPTAEGREADNKAAEATARQQSVKNTSYDDLLDNLRHHEQTGDHLSPEDEQAHREEVGRRQAAGDIPGDHPDFNKFNNAPRDLLNKQYHEMTRADHDRFRRYYAKKSGVPHDEQAEGDRHWAAVEKAVMGGHEVPAEVQKDYPDLFPERPNSAVPSDAPSESSAEEPTEVPAEQPDATESPAAKVPVTPPQHNRGDLNKMKRETARAMAEQEKDQRRFLGGSTQDHAYITTSMERGKSDKEPHQMTADEWADHYGGVEPDALRASAGADGTRVGDAAHEHRDWITKAVARNRAVPPEVQADYPDMFQKPAVSDTPAKPKAARKPRAGTPTVQDFGEVLPGARKHAAVPTGPKKPKEEKAEGETKPAWRRPYGVHQDAKTGKYFVTHGNQSKKGPGGPKMLSKPGEWKPADFDTAEQAESFATTHALASRHGVSNRGTMENPNYAIYRKVTDRKMPTVKDGFKTYDEAMRHMAANPHEILNHKFPDWEDYSYLDRVNREGPDNGKGKEDATPEDFKKFGFRGVQFGNWQTNKDGQTSLTHAYHSLHDLAHVTGLTPKQLSLGGRLGIAFGARGTGGKHAAKAHYELDHEVMNITKMQGAGSLGHEWFHALDHALSKEEHGDKTEHLMTNRQPYQSKHPEVSEAFKNLVSVMKDKDVTREVHADGANRDAERAHKNLAAELKDVQDRYETAERYHGHDLKAGRKSKFRPFTPEQKEKWEGLKAKILAGDLGEVKYHGHIPVHERVGEMDEMYKQATGRSLTAGQHESVANRLHWAIKRKGDADQKVKAAGEGASETRRELTDYRKAAHDLDKTMPGDYFSLHHEMAARAFQAYLADKLKEKERQSDYLVGRPDNGGMYAMLGLKPYPEGEERQKINGAFDDLFAAIRNHYGKK